MLFDTTFLIDYEREVKRSRPGAAHAFLVQHPNAPLYTSSPHCATVQYCRTVGLAMICRLSDVKFRLNSTLDESAATD